MTVLIDPPRWPAWGTIFSHLVSDSSLDELHAFAARHGVPRAAFDHDHYDVPERLYQTLVDGGAEPVGETELIRRLIRGGMRVRAVDKTPKRAVARARLLEQWEVVWPGHTDIRDGLLEWWDAPERHYHDVRHLWVVSEALTTLGAPPSAENRIVHLAAWFHDAVYLGVPGEDEEASAELAHATLDGELAASEVAEIACLVRVTMDHDPADDDRLGQLLVDADLSILGASAGRYDVYARDVRLDYAHVSDTEFAAGRRAVLQKLLSQPKLFRTERGRELWEARTRLNLSRELRSSALEEA